MCSWIVSILYKLFGFLCLSANVSQFFLETLHFSQGSTAELRKPKILKSTFQNSLHSKKLPFRTFSESLHFIFFSLQNIEPNKATATRSKKRHLFSEFWKVSGFNNKMVLLQITIENYLFIFVSIEKLKWCLHLFSKKLPHLYRLG